MNTDLSAKCCLGKGNLCGGINIHILPLQGRMSRYDNLYEQIASRSAVDSRLALLPDTDALSVVDTCRNRHLNLFLACNVSGTPAIRALVFDDLSGTATVRTGLHILHRTKERLLCKYNLSLTATLRAGLRCCSRLCTCSMAGMALIL